MTRHAYSWNVTFTSPFLNAGDVPSILVSTNDGASATTVATGAVSSSAAGSSVTAGLTGTSPRVEVAELVKGAVPMRFTISGLSPSAKYFTRVAAINKHGIGPWITSAYSSQPKQTTPSACRDVTVSAESGTRIGVWWHKPSFEGGDAISKYEVQWSTAESFGNLAPNRDSCPPKETTTTTTQSLALTPGQAYYVRVLPYNALGFGAPVTADGRVELGGDFRSSPSPTRARARSRRVSFVSPTKPWAARARWPRRPLTFDATAALMQEAIQTLPGIGAVEVQRVDQSVGYDVTSSDDSKYQWYVTFLSERGRCRAADCG